MNVNLPYNPKVLVARMLIALVTAGLLTLGARASQNDHLVALSEFITKYAAEFAMIIVLAIVPVDLQAKAATQKAVDKALDEAVTQAPGNGPDPRN